MTILMLREGRSLKTSVIVSSIKRLSDQASDMRISGASTSIGEFAVQAMVNSGNALPAVKFGHEMRALAVH